MNKSQRITVFLSTMVLLAVIYGNFQSPITNLGEPGIVIFSTLILLSFATLLAEHFFTRQTDVIASAIAVLFLFSPIRLIF